MTRLSPNALRVLEARYLRRDAARNVVETPRALYSRVAGAIAQAEIAFGGARDAERWQETFEAVMVGGDFLPNSPVLMNAGMPLGQLAACFVVPVHDSMESIFDALKAMALLQRAGGGTGFSFSALRPRGDVVGSTGGEASGPVSFMRVFDSATENIKQGGRRRGANMGVLRVDHPDILEFVGAKLDGRSLQNFNLSVGATDAFMRAVEDGRPYDLVHPGRRHVVERLPAREVFERIVGAAWANGDPGMLFLDAINRANPLPALGAIEATNPCGEVPLRPWESCILGSINLAHVVTTARPAPEIDWERLRTLVHTGVRFLDDAIEVNRDPLPQVAAATRAGRKIGLGVMGFAECLILLGVAYDSDAATAWADRLMAFIAAAAREASRQLARARGVFPEWARSRHAAQGEPMRNATRLSIAPTGTISIIAGTSGGSSRSLPSPTGAGTRSAASPSWRSTLSSSGTPRPSGSTAVTCDGTWKPPATSVTGQGSPTGSGACSSPRPRSPSADTWPSSGRSSATSTTPWPRRSTCRWTQAPSRWRRPTSRAGGSGSRA